MKQHEKEFFDSINQIIKEELTNKQVFKEQRKQKELKSPLMPAQGKPPNVDYFLKDLEKTMVNLNQIDISSFITKRESNIDRKHYEEVLSFLNIKNESFENIINKIYKNFEGFYVAKNVIDTPDDTRTRPRMYTGTKAPPPSLTPNEFLGYLVIYKTLRNLVREEAGTSGLNFENFCAYLLGGNKVSGQSLVDVIAKGENYTAKLISSNIPVKFSKSTIIEYFSGNDSINLILGVKSSTTGGSGEEKGDRGSNYINFKTRKLDINFLKYTVKNLLTQERYNSYNLNFKSLGITNFKDLEYSIEKGTKEFLINILESIELDTITTKVTNDKSVILEKGILAYKSDKLISFDENYNNAGVFPIREDLITNFYSYHVKQTVNNQASIIQNYLTVLENMAKQIKSIEILTTTGTTNALNNAKTSTEGVKTALEKIEIE